MEDGKTTEFFYEKRCKVSEPLGLCGRPSFSVICEVARSVGANGIGKIFIRKTGNGAVANSYSIMSVLMLAAEEGAELSVFTCEPSLVDKVDDLAQFIGTVSIDTKVDFSIEECERVFNEYQDSKRIKKTSEIEDSPQKDGYDESNRICMTAKWTPSEQPLPEGCNYPNCCNCRLVDS